MSEANTGTQLEENLEPLKDLETPSNTVKSYKISASEPDWERERCTHWWTPGQQLLKSIRNFQAWDARGGPMGKAACWYHKLEHRFWSVVSGADIPLECKQIQGGLKLPHPNGVVIHPKASIGPNCLLFQQVTLVKGVKLEGHVDVGAGAKIIRPVTIGVHAKIGANAVVLEDVPAGAIAVGIPARILNSSP